MTTKGARTFQLPITGSVLVVSDAESGRTIAHALDFDIVCEADSVSAALDKLAVSIKTYIEYGLGNDLTDGIFFPAPQEFWDCFERATPKAVTVPFRLNHNPLVLVQAMLNESLRTPCQAYAT